MAIAFIASLEIGMGALARGDVDDASQSGGAVICRVPHLKVRVEKSAI